MMCEGDCVMCDAVQSPRSYRHSLLCKCQPILLCETCQSGLWVRKCLTNVTLCSMFQGRFFWDSFFLFSISAMQRVDCDDGNASEYMHTFIAMLTLRMSSTLSTNIYEWTTGTSLGKHYIVRKTQLSHSVILIAIVNSIKNMHQVSSNFVLLLYPIDKDGSGW